MKGEVFGSGGGGRAGGWRVQKNMCDRDKKDRDEEVVRSFLIQRYHLLEIKRQRERERF